ncbi:MAG: acylphosphatase [Bacteroidota bacterium]
MTRYEMHLTGRVQGVGFRQFASERAQRRGITGWVRNERGGSVRIVAEGEKSDLDAFADELREGPPLARVNDLEIERKEPSNQFTSFGIRH